MKTTITVNGKPVEIELTADQVKAIKKAAVNPMEAYSTYKDVCEAAGIHPMNSLPFQNPATKKHVAINGAFKLMTIYEVFNEPDFVPDYTNSQQRKWFSWKDWVPSLGRFVYSRTCYAYTCTGLGARLCADTEPKEIYIAKTFEAEWNEFLNPQI